MTNDTKEHKGEYEAWAGNRRATALLHSSRIFSARILLRVPWCPLWLADYFTSSSRIFSVC